MSKVFGWWEDPEDPVHTLNACAHGAYGMSALWRDTEVRAVLARRRVRMEESSGFYLNEIDRITAKKYIPTDGMLPTAFLDFPLISLGIY